jgi:RNA polymerase sigma factor (sigma-70 family)
MKLARQRRDPSPTRVGTRPPWLWRFEDEFDELRCTLLDHGASAPDAEDWAQEAFLLAWQRAALVAPTRPPRAFLKRVALAKLRRARRRAREAPAGLVESNREAPDLNELVANRQTRGLLHVTLARLRRAHREPVTLHDLEGRSAREAARALDIKLYTFYSRLRVGRGALAARLRHAERFQTTRLTVW